MKAVLTDGRLGVRPSRGLVEHVNGVELADEVAAAEEFVQIDLAHALMLTEQGVFGRAQGRWMVAPRLRRRGGGRQQVRAGDPEVGTTARQTEKSLGEQWGPAGLDIQRARSRIDQKATSVRMADRRALHEAM